MGLFASAYSEVGRRLGLTMAGDSVFSASYELTGERFGHRVRVCRDLMLMKDLTIQVGLRAPLDLGLTLTPLGFIGRVGHTIGALFGDKAYMKSGDATLDNAFAFHADEEARVAELVRGARRALDGWETVGGDFRVDDLQVQRHRFIYGGWDEEPEQICGEVDGLVALATSLEEARAQVRPAAALLPHVPGFQALATRYRLETMVTPLATWGTIETYGFWARATRHAAGVFTVETAVYFPPGMAMGGTIRTARKPDEKRGATTEDASFDERFIVSSPAVLPTLSPEVRRALLNLADSGDKIMLSDRGLGLTTTLGAEPYPIGPRAEQGMAVMRAVESALRSHSAYR